MFVVTLARCHGEANKQKHCDNGPFIKLQTESALTQHFKSLCGPVAQWIARLASVFRFVGPIVCEETRWLRVRIPSGPLVIAMASEVIEFARLLVSLGVGALMGWYVYTQITIVEVPWWAALLIGLITFGLVYLIFAKVISRGAG